MTLLLPAVPVHDTATWRSPWDGAVANVNGATYVALSDGSVLGVAVRSQSVNPSELVLAYAPTVAAFLGGDSTMVVDRALVTATGGSSSAFRVMSGGVSRDPDDPSKILLVWHRVGPGATWTYGTGFASPSQGDVNQTYIYETSDDGATWTEIANFFYDATGSGYGVSTPNGPVQKFGSLYLVVAASRYNRRHVWSSADKATWTHRYIDNSGSGCGRGVAYRGSRFYVWGEAGLASSGDGTTWARYNTSVTGQGGPSFTYSLDGGATVRHGVIRRPSSSVSSVLRWESTTTADPAPAAFTTDEVYDPTGYALPAQHQPDLCVLSDTFALISTGRRIFGVPFAVAGGWSVGSIRIG